MTILKKWLEHPDKLRAEGQPVDWFPTTLAECLRHTEESGYWVADSVKYMLESGLTVHSPFAQWKAE